MNSTIVKNDSEIKSDILAELRYEPNVKETDIGVLVNEGTVTLKGFATSFGEKWNAVRAAKRVAGVNAIADDIEVRLPDSFVRNDSEIASAAESQIRWSASVPADNVKIIVRDGWVTLEGELEWWYQKKAAESAVENVIGVIGVSNLISIKPRLDGAEIEQNIESAFKRSAVIDAEAIEVETSGNSVILRGKVRNHAEKEAAESTAWAAPGVYDVDNQLTVKWTWLG